VQIVSEHSAHCLGNPVKKASGANLPLDVAYRIDPEERLFNFSDSAHCELQVTKEAELQKIANTIYAKGVTIHGGKFCLPPIPMNIGG